LSSRDDHRDKRENGEVKRRRIMRWEISFGREGRMIRHHSLPGVGSVEQNELKKGGRSARAGEGLRAEKERQKNELQ